nr:Chain s, model substrate polypeptide [Homo sapiens]
SARLGGASIAVQ